MPARWLYVSRRVDLIEVPNEPPWVVPVFTYGNPHNPTPFYRVTPQVVVWLDAAGAALERQVITGTTGAGTGAGTTPTTATREQLNEFIASMNPVWVFSGRYLDRAAVRAARLEPPSLPPVPDGPQWGSLMPALDFFPTTTDAEAETETMSGMRRTRRAG